MLSIGEVKQIVARYNINLKLSLLNLYSKNEISDLSAVDFEDFSFILDRIQCGRAACYREFLSGYRTLCFKQNVDRIPVRIFIYEDTISGEWIVVGKFDVEKREHTCRDHQKKCLQKHDKIKEFTSHRREVRLEHAELPSKSIMDETDLDFSWGESPTWSEVLDKLQKIWIMLNKKGITTKNKTRLNDLCNQAIGHLYNLLDNIGPNKPIAFFLFMPDQLTLQYHDNSSVLLPYLLIEDETQVFLTWLYINFEKQAKKDKEVVLAGIVYLQLKSFLLKKHRNNAKNFSESVLCSEFSFNQYKKSYEQIILSQSGVTQGFEISKATLPFWHSVSSECLLYQIKLQGYPENLGDIEAVTHLLSGLNLNHKNIIFHYLTKHSPLLDRQAIIDSIPFALERYSISCIVNHALTGWQDLFKEGHPWLDRHSSILRAASPLLKLEDDSPGSEKSDQIDDAAMKTTAASQHRSDLSEGCSQSSVVNTQSKPKPSNKKKQKKKKKKKKRKIETKAASQKDPSLMDILHKLRGSEDDWVDQSILSLHKKTNADILTTLNRNLKSLPPELMFLVIVRSTVNNVDVKQISLHDLVTNCDGIKIDHHTMTQLAQNDLYEVNGSTHSIDPLKRRLSSLLSCDEIEKLDMKQAPSDKEAIELITLIQENASVYRSDVHDKKLFWQKFCEHANIIASPKTQPAVIIVKRLIEIYRSDHINEALKQRVFNHIKIAFCYALKIYHVGVFSAKSMKEVNNLPPKQKKILQDLIAYTKNVSLSIIDMVSKDLDFGEKKSRIHDVRKGCDVSMFTFLLKFLDEESCDVTAKTTLQNVKSMFNKLISLGAEPGVCNSTHLMTNFACMKNELYECTLLHSFDLFQYFCDLGVAVENNFSIVKNHTRDAFIRHFVAGQTDEIRVTLLPVIRFRIVYLHVKIIEIFLQSDISVWKEKEDVCNSIIKILGFEQSFKEFLSNFSRSTIQIDQAAIYFAQLTQCRSILSFVESQVYLTANDYKLDTIIKDGDLRTIEYFPHINYVYSMNEFDSQTRILIKTLQLILIINSELFNRKEVMQSEEISQDDSRQFQEYGKSILNFLRNSHLDFSNFYITSVDGIELPLISFSVKNNLVDLFTVLYEKGANLNLRSTQGLAPSDYVSEKTDPRIRIALIGQRTPKAVLSHYEKRYQQITAFLAADKDRKIASDGQPIEDLHKLLSVNSIDSSTKLNLFDRFESLISRGAVNHSTFMILIKWWVCLVFNMNMLESPMPKRAILRIRGITRLYLSHPSPTSESKDSLHKHLLFSLWRCHVDVVKESSSAKLGMKEHLSNATMSKKT